MWLWRGKGANIHCCLDYEATVGGRVVGFACILFDGRRLVVEVQSCTEQSAPVESTDIYIYIYIEIQKKKKQL